MTLRDYYALSPLGTNLPRRRVWAFFSRAQGQVIDIPSQPLVEILSPIHMLKLSSVKQELWISGFQGAFLSMNSKCELQVHSREENKSLKSRSKLPDRYLRGSPGRGFCAAKVGLSRGHWRGLPGLRLCRVTRCSAGSRRHSGNCVISRSWFLRYVKRSPFLLQSILCLGYWLLDRSLQGSG